MYSNALIPNAELSLDLFEYNALNPNALLLNPVELLANAWEPNASLFPVGPLLLPNALKPNAIKLSRRFYFAISNVYAILIKFNF